MKSLHVAVWQQPAIIVNCAHKTSSIVKKTHIKTASNRLFAAGMPFDKG
jgi:hypothetical protein